MDAGTLHQLMSGVLEGHSSPSVGRHKGLKGHFVYLTHKVELTYLGDLPLQPEEVCCRTLPVTLEGAYDKLTPDDVIFDAKPTIPN